MIKKAFPFLLWIGGREGINIDHLKPEAVTSDFGSQYSTSTVLLLQPPPNIKPYPTPRLSNPVLLSNPVQILTEYKITLQELNKGKVKQIYGNFLFYLHETGKNLVKLANYILNFTRKKTNKRKNIRERIIQFH